MRFLADMGVSQRIVEWLRQNGHDTVHFANCRCNVWRTQRCLSEPQAKGEPF